MGSVVVKGTGKIGACPKNPELLHELVRQQRRACNLAISCFMEADRGLVEPQGPDLGQTALRATIRDFVRSGRTSAGCPLIKSPLDNDV